VARGIWQYGRSRSAWREYYGSGAPFAVLFSLAPRTHLGQAQGIVKPGMYVAAVANVWNVFMNWFLIFGLSWGYLGAAAARITTQWVMVFCLLAYMKVCCVVCAPRVCLPHAGHQSGKCVGVGMVIFKSFLIFIMIHRDN
jgi:Na+-driven multidrug efflux pump